MTSTAPTYSFDTSALIDGLERYYPEATFPGLWDRVDTVVQQGRFLISEEVLVEASRWDASAKAWTAQRRSSILVPTDALIAGHVATIGQRFPTWTTGGRNQADPFVIATAIALNSIVVTGERAGAGTNAKPKIPYACESFGVRSMSFLDFVQSEGWVFN